MVNIKRLRDEEKEKLADEELSFLKDQLRDEERRRSVIEGKTGQLLGQVSIVISLIALFVPLISNQINNLPIWQKIVGILLFLIVLIAFIISIWIASSSWLINKYPYHRPDLNDLHTPTRSKNRLMLIERHKDILLAIMPQHVDVNNSKGTNLIRAGLAFRLGILLLGVLAVGLSIALSLVKTDIKPLKIDDPIRVEILNQQLNSTRHSTAIYPFCRIDSE